MNIDILILINSLLFVWKQIIKNKIGKLKYKISTWVIYY